MGIQSLMCNNDIFMELEAGTVFPNTMAGPHHTIFQQFVGVNLLQEPFIFTSTLRNKKIHMKSWKKK